MDHPVCRLLLSLLLLSASHAYAERSYVISPSVGSASISNISGYKNSPYVRIDGSFHLIPEVGFNLFIAEYAGFNSSGSGNDVNIKLNSFGAGVTGKWPVHPHVQPYIRLDYIHWNAKAGGLGRTLAKDQGNSAGLALGVQFPIKKSMGSRPKCPATTR